MLFKIWLVFFNKFAMEAASKGEFYEGLRLKLNSLVDTHAAPNDISLFLSDNSITLATLLNDLAAPATDAKPA